jgi:uncharacterized membrane protein YkoI
MKRTNWILPGIVILLALGLVLATGCGKKESKEQAETQPMEETQRTMPPTELPAKVMAAVEATVPDAEVAMAEVSEEGGITVYDIEFKNDMGEMEVADDGTVIEVVSIVTMDDLPEAAAAAIQKAAGDMTINRLEKSEIRSEIDTEGETAAVTMLENLRYKYEAELARNDSTAEITVDADGNIVEPLKWEME